MKTTSRKYQLNLLDSSCQEINVPSVTPFEHQHSLALRYSNFEPILHNESTFQWKCLPFLGSISWYL